MKPHPLKMASAGGKYSVNALVLGLEKTAELMNHSTALNSNLG